MQRVDKMRDTRRISVLIVDDDILLLDMLRNGLYSERYYCETVTTAESALELLHKTSFDVMIADIALPGMRGFELTEKAKNRAPNMAVIIMTGFIEDISYDEAIEAGASDFIKKPFTLRELRARLKQVKMQERLRTLFLRDDLTGLYNRRGFFTLCEHLFKLAVRQKKGIFMLYADVDNLKWINDNFGHQEGDLALKQIANIFKTNFRESDVVARIGGDEFVVVPVGTSEDGVKIVTARLQHTIEAYNTTSKLSYALSVSAGIAYYDPGYPCSIDELLSQADNALYKAKANGRNRIEVS
jgi:diguanylate cyclase (GGDEF)-like protein